MNHIPQAQRLIVPRTAITEQCQPIRLSTFVDESSTVTYVYNVAGTKILYVPRKSRKISLRKVPCAINYAQDTRRYLQVLVKELLLKSFQGFV